MTVRLITTASDLHSTLNLVLYKSPKAAPRCRFEHTLLALDFIGQKAAASHAWRNSIPYVSPQDDFELLVQVERAALSTYRVSGRSYAGVASAYTFVDALPRAALIAKAGQRWDELDAVQSLVPQDASRIVRDYAEACGWVEPENGMLAAYSLDQWNLRLFPEPKLFQSGELPASHVEAAKTALIQFEQQLRRQAA
jgi:hypothetical protein